MSPYLLTHSVLPITTLLMIYLLGNSLASVCQLAEKSGAITLPKNYNPYGNVSAGWDWSRSFMQINNY